MPTDPESKRTTIHLPGDTGVSLHLAEINRLQYERDQLAELVRVAVDRMFDPSPKKSIDEDALAINARLVAILRGGCPCSCHVPGEDRYSHDHPGCKGGGGDS